MPTDRETEAGEGRSLDDLHAVFVSEHVEVKPAPLPVGAGDQVAAAVDHLHAAVEVRDVFDAVAAEGRVVTGDERETLEHAHGVLVDDNFPEPSAPDA